MAYRLMPDGSVFDAAGNQHPPDPANSGYAAFLAWRAAGGEPEIVVPPPPRRLVERAVIVERLIAAGKLAAARQALDAASIEMRERWNTKSAIYADDPDALALLKLIGADPATILAP